MLSMVISTADALTPEPRTPNGTWSAAMDTQVRALSLAAVNELFVMDNPSSLALLFWSPSKVEPPRIDTKLSTSDKRTGASNELPEMQMSLMLLSLKELCIVMSRMPTFVKELFEIVIPSSRAPVSGLGSRWSRGLSRSSKRRPTTTAPPRWQASRGFGAKIVACLLRS